MLFSISDIFLSKNKKSETIADFASQLSQLKFKP
jgi:hypothetical protein